MQPQVAVQNWQHACHELCRQASTRGRRALNKVIFTRLHVDADSVGCPNVTGDELNDGLATVVRAALQQSELVGTRLEGGVVALFGETYEAGALPEEDAIFSEVFPDRPT